MEAVVATHRLDPHLLEARVRVVVVGIGGTGSAIASGLPYLHQAMRAFGHPHGLDVTLVDGDDVSPANCVRQPFNRGEIGHNKAVVMATRINCHWGLDWKAIPVPLDPESSRPHTQPGPADIVIGCVDSRKARRAIRGSFARRYGSRYWLDFGNDADYGQFVLGEFEPMELHTRNGAPPPSPRLPRVDELYPELLDASLDVDDGPSCSAIEALTRQAPFVNQVLASHALALLAQLFRYGEISHHGGFVNVRTGRMSPIPVPAPPAPGAGRGARARRRKKAAAR